MTSNPRMAILIAATISCRRRHRRRRTAQAFSADQRHEIESIVKKYLVEHPDVLQDVMAELDKRQQDAEADKPRASQKITLRSSIRRTRSCSAIRRVMSPWSSSSTTTAAFASAPCPTCSTVEDQSRSQIRPQGISGPGRRLGRSRPRRGCRAHARRPGKKYIEFHQKLLAGAGRPTRRARSPSPRRSASTCRASRRTWTATR